MSEAVSLVAKLEELEKKVVAATAIINNLREENHRLKTALAEKVRELNAMQSQLTSSASDVEMVGMRAKIAELEVHQREYQDWQQKKDDIRKRLESVMGKIAHMEETLAEPISEEEESEES